MAEHYIVNIRNIKVKLLYWDATDIFSFASLQFYSQKTELRPRHVKMQ